MVIEKEKKKGTTRVGLKFYLPIKTLHLGVSVYLRMLSTDNNFCHKRIVCSFLSLFYICYRGWYFVIMITVLIIL